MEQYWVIKIDDWQRVDSNRRQRAYESTIQVKLL